MTLNQLVELFEVIVGRRINKEYTNIDKDDPLLRKPDLTVLNSLYFNTKCTHKVFTPIQSGLSSTYLYFLNKIR
jgi:hypothetical protein